MKINERFADFILDEADKDLYLHIGGYGSSKSHGITQKILLMLAREKRKAIVVRRYFNSHKESTFALFKEIASEYFGGYVKAITKSPLKIELTNGSEVLFYGLDDPEKLKSIANVSLAWIEEASEVNVEGFREVVGRMRSKDAKNIVILSSNPISTQNWLYVEFFKDKINEREFYDKKTIEFEYQNMDCVAYHSTVTDNMFVPQEYIDRLDGLAETDEYLYRIARLGEFGVLGDRVFDIGKIKSFNDDRLVTGKEYQGLDLGFSVSYNAGLRVYVDDRTRNIWITEEIYNNNITTQELAVHLKAKGFDKSTIFVDLAEPKTIRELNIEGIPAVRCKKEPGNKIQGVKKIRGYTINIHERCKQTYQDFTTLVYYKDKQGVVHEDKFNFDCHTLNKPGVYKLGKITGTLKCQSEVKAIV
jgi:phage terminase large subunit